MFDVIIIGSGPAGLTAAIYASRANLRVFVIEGEQPGGQLTTTTEVENFPGFKNGILGPELMMEMKEQAKRFNAEFMAGNATKVSLSDAVKKVWVSEKEFEAKTIIIATGASSRWLHLPKEKAFIGKGLSTCATCDGYFYREKEIAVIGGGDSAMEEANFLTKFAKHVTIIHRSDQFRASKIMLDRAKQNSKISFMMNYEVVEYIGEQKLERILLKNTQTSQTQEFSLDGLFLAIGHIPNTKLFEGQIELDEKGYIKITQRNHTSQEGVFTCGDVDDVVYRQAITAAAEGCKAAMECARYLEHKQ